MNELSKDDTLGKMLINILGSNNVYFQPPESILIEYPAIVYELDKISATHANNKVYNLSTRYVLKYITKDCNSEIVKKLSELPMCTFDRHFNNSNLNHYVYTIYF